MGVMTSTGYTTYVCLGKPATNDIAGFEELTWVIVNGVTSVPAFGAQRDQVSYQPLATGTTVNEHGFIQHGNLTIEGANDNQDAGQNLIRQAVLTVGQNISTKLVDAGGDIDYAHGKAFSKTKNPGGANSMVGTSMTIVFNDAIVPDYAA